MRLFFLCALFSLGLAFSLPQAGCTTSITQERAQESPAETPAETTEAAGEKLLDLAAESPPESPSESMEAATEKAAEIAREAAKETQAESIRPDGGEAVPEALAEKAPSEGLPPSRHMVILQSDFTKTTLSILDIDRGLAVIKDKDYGLPGDVIARIHEETLFLLVRRNRPDADDSVVGFDLAKGVKKGEIALSPKANPQDLVVDPASGRVFVAQYGKPEIFVFNTSTWTKTISIQVGGLAETSKKACAKNDDCTDGFGGGSGLCLVPKGVCQSDGIPEISSLWLEGDDLHVLAQGLDQNDGFAPVESKLGTIFTPRFFLSGSLPLAGLNPAFFVADPRGGVGIVQVGSVFSPKDGGIESFDPKTKKLGGTYWITEDALGGSLPLHGALALVSAKVGYTLLSDAQFKTSLVQFDPSTGQKTKEILPKGELSHLALTPEGEILVADKAQGKAGILVFDALQGTPKGSLITSGSLPPVQILVTQVPSPRLP